MNYLSISLLKTFTKKELKGFLQLMECPYFNKDEILIKLLDNLMKFFAKSKVIDEKALIDIYTDTFEKKAPKEGLRKNQQKSLHNKFNLLTRHIEKFLYFKNFDIDDINKRDIILRTLLERKQYKLFIRNYKRFIKVLNENKIRDGDYFKIIEQLEFHQLTYSYLSGSIKKENNFKQLNYCLDVNYFLKRLSVFITMLGLPERQKERLINERFYELLESILKLNEYQNEPLVQIYIAVIVLMKQPNQSNFKVLSDLIFLNSAKLSKEDLAGLYTVLSNFYTIQFQKGKPFFNEWLSLYKQMDKLNLFVEGDFIHLGKLKNAITAACRVQEFSWGSYFIKKYKMEIPKFVRVSVFNYLTGAIAFYRKEYDEALRHFIRVDSINLTYDINCRIMIIKSHYEIDKEYDERTVQIYRSAEKYFTANKQLANKTSKSYKNFIRTLINLYRIKHNATKMTLDKLKDKLDQQKLNVDKSWLVLKIKELEK